MNEPEFVITIEELAKIKLNLLTQIKVILKSLVMIPVSWVTFSIFYIRGMFAMPSTVVNIIFLSEKVKYAVRQFLKEKDANI